MRTELTITEHYRTQAELYAQQARDASGQAQKTTLQLLERRWLALARKMEEAERRMMRRVAA
jgi:hypothetical protein